jgi:hypothetical protein
MDRSPSHLRGIDSRTEHKGLSDPLHRRRATASGLSQRLRDAMNHLRVLPRRILLETPGVPATVPMLRGVWGAALHDLDPRVYETVFHPQVAGGTEASPCYVIRPAPPDPNFAPAMEWLTFGAAIDHDATLQRAWDIASGMGLGPERRRFHLRRVLTLSPAGDAIPSKELGGSESALLSAWPLSAAAWPLVSPDTTPCRIAFHAPVRMIRRGALIEEPNLCDVVVGITRRIAAFLRADLQDEWRPLSREALELARSTPCGVWRGGRLDLHRYSAAQQAELDLRGVNGSFDLPRGPGELWPLLAAAQWLHVGKGTIVGLGQLSIEVL